MRRAAEALRIALSPNHIAVGTHGAGNHCQLPLPHPGGSLAVNPDIRIIVALPCRIIVMTVDLPGKFHGPVHKLPDFILHHFLYPLHHPFPVLKRILHGQLHPGNILLPFPGIHRKKCQPVFILYLAVPHLIQRTCLLMILITDPFPKMTAAGMNHEPQKSLLILLKFNKMIASAQSPHLIISILNQRI